MPQPGTIYLNCASGDVPAESTIIISGPPRSGTSMVAAVAKAGGLWLGDQQDQAFFEDWELGGAIEPHPRLSHRMRILARNLRHPFLASRGVDVRTLQTLIASRNARFPKWGFKRPNIAIYLGSGGFDLFRNPRLIVILRDPVAMAERIVLAHRSPIKGALGSARRHLHANMLAIRALKIPTLLLSYEKAAADRDSLFTSVFEFCGIACPRDRYDRIEQFVKTAGAEYRRFSRGEICGYVEGYRNGVLVGWCRIPGKDEPVSVDIFVDNRKIATVRADVYRTDLHALHYGQGRHGYRAVLPRAGLPLDATVRAFIAGTDNELENSGRRLADLTRPMAE